MAMKKILFVTLGHLSAGEFTIAFEFAKGLPAADYEVCFLTSERGQAYLEKNNIRHTVLKRSVPVNLAEDKLRNKAITDQLFKEFQPDCIIASDVYTLWYSYHWSGLDFEILREYGIPLGSFDSYEFGSTDYVQDYYGGYKATLPDFMDRCDFVIRYCPLNKPVDAPPRVKFTPLFTEVFEHTPEEKADFDRKFRPSGTDKVLFMVSSNWEELNVNRFPALSNMLTWVPKMIMNYLALLEGPITIIHIGPQGWEPEMIQRPGIIYHHLNFLSPRQYDVYLSCSDVLLSTNLISTTVAKAVFAGVPPVVLQNDKLINFSQLEAQLAKMPSWYQRMASEVRIAYPFRLFPFGWHGFLKPLLADNPYMDTVVRASFFQKTKTIEAIQTCLSDATARSALQEKQRSYVSDILKLPTPAQIIDSLNL
jgi:hypothetical protein